jgi:MerR family transcriptional regulator, light-induced transcriptional regulator
MSEKAYETFLDYLKKEDKQYAVTYAINLLNEGIETIETLYLNYLAKALIDFTCTDQDEDICIWKEHTRTSIIRTILEISYQHVLKRLETVQKVHKKIVVTTPAFEYHEIGAIMNTHFMLLEGFDATYIGANTPKSEILSAIKAYRPDYIALSVTNPYNLVITKQVTDELKLKYPEVKIILGGQAFHHHEALTHLQYDHIFYTLEDLKAFRKEVQS